MAQTVNFKFNGITSETSLTKLNRDKVYGWSEYVYTDSDNHVCSFLTLLDGKTFIGQGGMALKSIDSKGNEIDKSTLVAHYEDESVATKYPSVFDSETELSADKTLQDYMSMDVKSVYQLAEVAAELLLAVQTHKVLYFKFNYRADYEPDDAFLISQGDNLFIIVGKINNFAYSSLAVIPLDLEDEAEEASDEIDFNMF